MKIRSINIVNYKGFRDSGTIELSPTLNVIAGQNNVGKTALVESFTPYNYSRSPHKSDRIPEGEPLAPASHAHFALATTGKEIDLEIRTLGGQLYIPSPDVNFTKEFLSTKNTNVTISTDIDFGAGGFSGPFPSHGLYNDDPARHLNTRVSVSNNRIDLQFDGPFNERRDSLPDIMGSIYRRKVFSFKAERMNLSQSRIAATLELNTNADNLPSVIMQLNNSDPNAFARYIDAVKTVVPSVKHLSSVVSQADQTMSEIKIWTSETRRRDLALSLRDAGTGVGQVLAILYVAIAMKEAIVIIDEPNSFLNPGAAKKLIDLLKDMDHQYIISTHSPEIIAAGSSGAAIHAVSWDGQESHVRAISARDMTAMRTILGEIGASFADLFGADQIIWVEGYTEEECFPLLLKQVGRKLPPGVVIRAVRNTGDFLKRNAAEQVFDIYERLSTAHALIPPALAFSFDDEGRSQSDKADLVRASKGRVHFLPRRTYENFLLSATAIAHVLSSDGMFHVTPESVEKIFEADRAATGIEKEPWGARCDGAKILEKTFSELSKGALEYRKTRHSMAITMYLLETDPEWLRPLLDYVAELTEVPKNGGVEDK